MTKSFYVPDPYMIPTKDQLADTGKVMPQWISVKERLPEEGEEIFWCHAPTCEMVVGQLVGPTPYFTHWMPLPEPPKEES